MTAKELREKRAALATRIQEMAKKANDEKRDFTAEEKPNWEAVNKDYDELTRQIEIAERAERVAAEQADRDSRPGKEDRNAREEEDREEREESDELTDAELGLSVRSIKPEVFALTLQGWMRKQSGLDVEQRHEKAARLCGINLNRRHLDIDLGKRAMTPAEYRAMSAISLVAGASTIQPSFVTSFEKALLDFGGMRQAGEVMRTDTGAEMSWPTVDDTTNEGEIVGENTVTNDGDVVTGLAKWGAHKYSSKVIKVPVELMEDSAFDLATEIGGMAGERVGRRQNRDFTTGDGAGKARGVITAATLGATSAGATAITYNETLALEHSVDPAYRSSPKSQYMFHDNILLYLRQLQDSQGRPLWQSNVALGQPDTFNGKRYQVNQSMASSVAASNVTMAFGDFSKYKIRDVRTLRLRRLVERYADADQEGFVAFMRSDGNLLDAGGHPIKYLQQHA
jgi:HK97 family phage major capsid protein